MQSFRYAARDLSRRPPFGAMRLFNETVEELTAHLQHARALRLLVVADSLSFRGAPCAAFERRPVARGAAFSFFGGGRSLRSAIRRARREGPQQSLLAVSL